MEITKKQAQRLIKSCKAREVGTVLNQGWRWMAVERLDMQGTDHYRIERANE
jgi:IS1 family transposase